MPIHQIRFKNEGGELLGILHLPSAAKKRRFPTVLFLHGFLAGKTEAHRTFVQMSRVLEKAGIASLRFDFRGCGESSGGSETMTLASMISDAEAALKWVSKRPGVDPKRIALLGMSLGGGLAATLAGKQPKFKALALWAPVGNLLECLKIKAGGRRRVKKIMKLEQVDYFGNLLSHEFFSEFELFQPVEAIKNFHAPTLIVQGGSDETVPPHQSREYAKALRGLNPQNRHALISEADHTFASVPWQRQLHTLTAEFFEKALK